LKYRAKKEGKDSAYKFVSRRYNLSQLARDTKLTRPTIIDILSGNTKKPGHDKLDEISQYIRMKWEYDDEGLYFYQEEVKKTEAINEPPSIYFSPEDEQWEKLSPDTKRQLIEIARMFKKMPHQLNTKEKE